MLSRTSKFSYLGITEAEGLCILHHLFVQLFGVMNLFGNLIDENYLIYEPRVNLGCVENLIGSSA